MELCGELSKGFFPNCDFPLIAGVNDRLILMNKDDIDTISYDVTNRQVITDIILKTGKSAYVFQGQNRSNEPATRLVKGRYSSSWDHECIFKIFGDGIEVKTIVNSFPEANIVVVVENNYRGAIGDAAFTVYGIGGGLETQEAEQVKADADTDGAYHLVLRSSEFGREPLVPNAWFDTDYGTTKLLVDALVDAPIVLNISPTIGAIAGADTYVIQGEKFTGATQVDYVDTLAAVTNEPGFVVDNDGQITIASSVALIAGTYKIRVTGPGGVGESLAILVIS